jgi:hypothetical protein
MAERAVIGARWRVVRASDGAVLAWAGTRKIAQRMALAMFDAEVRADGLIVDRAGQALGAVERIGKGAT